MKSAWFSILWLTKRIPILNFPWNLLESPSNSISSHITGIVVRRIPLAYTYKQYTYNCSSIQDQTYDRLLQCSFSWGHRGSARIRISRRILFYSNYLGVSNTMRTHNVFSQSLTLTSCKIHRASHFIHLFQRSLSSTRITSYGGKMLVPAP